MHFLDERLYTVMRRPRRLLGGRRNVHLLHEEPWPDLTPLRYSSETLRRLVVTGPVADISAVNEMAALQELTLHTHGSTGTLDLVALRHLRELALDRGEIDVSLQGGESLRRVWLSGCDQAWAEFVGELPCLEELTLIGSRSLPRRLPRSLRKLRIGAFTKWPEDLRIEGIENLVDLSLESVRGIRDLRSFSSADKLSSLYVEDCDEFSSLAGPGLAPNFEELLAGRSVRRSNR